MGSLPVSLNSWVDESDVGFIVQVGSDFLGNFDESSEGKFVGKVVVQVVFVVLKFVHLLNGVVVVSDLWEGERFIVELFGGNSEFWGLSTSSKSGFNFHGVV